MQEQYDDIFLSRGVELEGKSVEELIVLVGDAGQGCRPEALDRILAMGFDAHCRDLENAVRNNADANLRNGAMEVLVRFGDQAIPRLLFLLKDCDEEVRNFSAVMLGDIGNRKAVVPLIQALRDPDANVRHGAAEALGRIGDRTALMPLLDLLKEDFWLQYPAIAALAAMKDRRAVPHLFELLEDGMVGVPVIDALGEIGDPRALNPLGCILNFSENHLAGAAARGMVKIYKQLDDRFRYKNSLETAEKPVTLGAVISGRGVERLKELLKAVEDKESVKAAVTLLGWVKEVSVLPDLFNLLADDDYINAIESSILAMGKDSVVHLVGALRHPEANARMVAVRSLCWLGERRDLHELLPLLHDADEKVQLEVLTGIRKEAPDDVLPHLFGLAANGSDVLSAAATEVLCFNSFVKIQDFLGALVSSPDPVKRRRAAGILGQCGRGGATGALICLMKDPDASVRREAVRGAGLQRIKETLPELLELLNDAETGIKEEAVMSLAAFGDTAPLPEILRLLGSDDESLDCAVVQAVGGIGSAGGGEALLEYLERGGISRKVEYVLIETLGGIKYIPAVALISARYLSHNDPDFRRLSIKVMEELAGREALRVFIEAAGRDPHWSVRIAALQAIGKIGGEEAIPVLSAALADSDNFVRKKAMLILGDQKSFKAVMPLVMQLVDPELGRYAFDALLRSGHAGLPWLHRIMKGDYQLEIRERVIDLVGKFGDRRSIKPLLELLNDPNDAIRLAAIDSLVFCVDTVPLKRLFHVKRNDPSEEVKSKAESALKSLTMEKFF